MLESKSEDASDLQLPGEAVYPAVTGAWHNEYASDSLPSTPPASLKEMAEFASTSPP